MFRTRLNVHMLKDLFTGHNEIRAFCIFQSNDSDDSWLYDRRRGEKLRIKSPLIYTICAFICRSKLTYIQMPLRGTIYESSIPCSSRTETSEGIIMLKEEERKAKEKVDQS